MQRHRSGLEEVASMEEGQPFPIRHAKPVSTVETFDFNEVAKLTAVTPVVGRAAVDKRKQQQALQDGGGGRREDKENSQRLVNKRPKVGGQGMKAREKEHVDSETSTSASADDVGEYVSPPPPGAAASSSRPPSSSSTASSTSTEPPPDSPQQEQAPVPAAVPPQPAQHHAHPPYQHHHHHAPPPPGAKASTIARYPRPNYRESVRTESYAYGDAPVERKLLNCMRLHMMVDITAVNEILANTRYARLPNEMLHFAEWRVLEGLETVLEGFVKEDVETQAALEKAKIEAQAATEDLAKVEANLQRLRERKAYLERLHEEQQQADEAMDEDQTDVEADEENEVMTESRELLDKTQPAVEANARAFTALLNLLQSRVETLRDKGNDALKMSRVMAELTRRIQTAGLPHVNEPKRVIKQLTAKLPEGTSVLNGAMH